jgi:hypothetical protein
MKTIGKMARSTKPVHLFLLNQLNANAMAYGINWLLATGGPPRIYMCNIITLSQ